MKRNELESLANATLANALVQAVVHFPRLLAQLELSAGEALSSALAHAEVAIARAPHLADGHAALGRIILCHHHQEATDDALEVLRHALTLDSEHDPAQIATASALFDQGDVDGALEHVEQVLRRGSGLPQPLLLRALIQLHRGDTAAARR